MSPDPRAGSLLVVVSRVYWLMCGPMILLLLLFKIVVDGSGWLTANDLVFVIALGLLPLARWIEFRSGEPLTSEGQPATSSHFRRYVLSASMLGVGAWVAANFIGNHVLAG